MRRKLFTASLALVGSGAFLISQSGPSGVEVDADELARSAADGSGAARIDLGETDVVVAETSAVPTSLDDVRAIGTRAPLEAAYDSLQAAVEADPDNGQLCVLFSEVCRRVKDAAGAMRYGKRGAELLPTNGAAHHTYARALALHMQTTDKLSAMMSIGAYKAELQNAIDLDPGNWEAAKEQILMFAFAPKPIGDRERAKELARTLAERHPARGTECLGRAVAMAGEVEEGIRILREASAAHPEDRDLHWVLGRWLERAELRDEADAEFLQAMEGALDETHFQARFQRAQMRVDSGEDLEQAVTILDEYVAADPFWEWSPPLAQAFALRGRAQEALGRPERARADFERALELDPELEAAREGLERLE